MSEEPTERINFKIFNNIEFVCDYDSWFVDTLNTPRVNIFIVLASVSVSASGKGILKFFEVYPNDEYLIILILSIVVL